MSDPEASEGPGEGQTRRAVTVRAVVIGGLLALGLAVLAPWRDATYSTLSMQIPPIITLVLVGLAAVVNPLLGRFRLCRGEVVVITAMLLAGAGVAGLGLARTWPPLPLGTPLALAQETKLQELRVETTTAERAAAVARRSAIAEARFARWDEDGDGVLPVVDGMLWASADVDGDGLVTRAEYLAQARAERPEDAWRWPVPTGLVPLVPEAGPVPDWDPEYRHVVDGYFDGLPPLRDRQRVRHRSRVTFTDAEGVRHVDVPAYQGIEVEAALLAGIEHLDLDDPAAGAALRGLRPGESSADLTVEAVEPAGLPWGVWGGLALAWAPLVAGALFAMIALARLVHHQWMHNERLPYPLANVLADLTEDPQPGRRWNRVVGSRAFQIGFVLTACVILWKGLFAFDYLPFDITLAWNLWGVFGGGTHQLMPDVHWMITPTLYPSVVAIAFLLTKEIGFSLWAVFIGTQLLIMITNLGGIPLQGEQVAHASMGGMLVFLIVILWWGRRYYSAVLRAAFGRHEDPVARAAAPYVWLLLGAMGLAFVALIAHGAAPLAALIGILLALGAMLLMARLVAEAGIPFPPFPDLNTFNLVLVRLFGTGFGPGSWIPVLLYGSIATSAPRESLLGYQVTSHFIADRAGVRPRRIVLLAIATVAVVGVVATVGTLLYHYLGGGAWRSGGAGTAKGQVLVPLTEGGSAAETPWGAYGTGAGVTGLLAAARIWLSWWPIHPIGFIMCMSTQLQRCWFSYFTGWLVKTLVLRYGGPNRYRDLKPAVIGIIAGEAIILVLFLGVKMAWEAAGKDVPFFLTLP